MEMFLANEYMSIMIHIGLPRTGTTVLQKHLFPNCKNTFVVSKKAYASSGNIRDHRNPLIGLTTKEELRLSLEMRGIEKAQITDFYVKYILTPLADISNNKRDPEVENLICTAVTRLKNISKHQDLLFSSERICDCSASLRGDSIHNSVDEEFLLYSLARVCTNVGRQYPLVMACFREPISYLRSKYIRTWGIRQNGNLRKISPKEYIQKQSLQEKRHPVTSALSPAKHSEFIRQLQRHAYVKAFGFQELIGSG